MTRNISLRIFQIVLFILGLICSIAALAQRDTTLNMESEFTDQRKLFLRDANKLSTVPLVKEQVVEMTSIKYSTLPTKKVFVIEPQPITAAKVNVDEKLPKLYRGYIRAGYGTYNTVPADFYYTDGRSKKGTYGAHYQLLRGDGVILNDNDSIPDRYSTNRAEVWGKRFFDKFTLKGGLNWERNVSHWYGFNNKIYTKENVVMDSLRQRLNTIGGNASFSSFNRDTTDWNYDFDLGVRNTKDLYLQKETNVDVLSQGRRYYQGELFDLQVGLNYNKFGYYGQKLNKYGFPYTDAGSLPFSGDAEFKSRTWDNGVLKMGGTAQTQWKELRAKAGLMIYFDLRDVDRPARVYPIAEVSYSIAKGVIVPYAGVRGSTTPTTYLSLYQQNPYIITFPNLRNLNTRLDAYGGIGGAISRSLSYKAGVNFLSYENFAYFVNDSLTAGDATHHADRGLGSVGNKFTIVYDNLKVFNIFGELALYQNEKWKANVRGDYFKYSLGNEARAWHQPGFKITASGQYKLKDKFFVSADIFFLGQRWAKSLVKVGEQSPEKDHLGNNYYAVKLKGYTDLNLKVEYRYNKRISLWAQMNNAMALKYQRWNSYPVQQFVGTVGFTFAF